MSGVADTMTAEEMRMLDGITHQERFSRCPNPEASALFAVLKDMLGKKPKDETVDRFLMQNLTAVAKAALMWDRSETIPGETGSYDHVVIRTTKAVVAALDLAIRTERIQTRCGRPMYGKYVIPTWFMEERAGCCPFDPPR
jgi:hypothetical protein